MGDHMGGATWRDVVGMIAIVVLFFVFFYLLPIGVW